ncbi:MAG TPA: adenylate/guanylate cyclase domain-containing protein [Nitrososphaerales archaeon]|nr:adenylate/guanylate cyclase domain-containing protein [Nitrososphaerales archaeon]
MAAIMFTDMIGYTALGQKNETLSLALVEEQAKLIRSILSRHGGREIKTIGDAFMVEFPNAVDAVRCAYDIQRAVREFNLSLAPDKRIHLRIGLHLGEVIESHGDIAGDAVNVASRIESLAEDGGICLTQQVYDHVRNKVDFHLASLGRRSLKNVAESIEIYRVALPWEEARLPVQLDPKRIAVLPFVNMSPDPNDSYFADGITEEVISTVSNIGGLSVISRTSIMGYKGTTKKVGEIGSELKAGSVLEGSFRKAGSKIRVTTQLIDVNNDSHVWTQAYDRELDDIFAIQTDIANQVAEALKVRILPDERLQIERVPTRNTEALSLYLKGRYYWNERTKESVGKAVKYFEEAVKRDPKFALAYSGIADCYSIYGAFGWLKPEDAFPRSKEYAMRALEIDPILAEPHTTLGDVLNSYEGKWEESEAEFKRALELKPNYSLAHMWYGLLLSFLRKFDEAREQFNLAVALDPLSRVGAINKASVPAASGRPKDAISELETALEKDPDFAYVHSALGWTYHLDSRSEDGIRELEKSVEMTGGDLGLKVDLVCALGFSGRMDEAVNILKEVQEAAKVEYVSKMKLAQAHFAIGKNDDAFNLLEEALNDHSLFTQGSSYLSDMMFDPWFAQVRKDPRWDAFAMRLKVPQP